MPVQRAKTPLRIVTSPPAMRNAAKPMAESRKGPAEELAIARVTTGIRVGTLSRRARDDDNRHDHARHARYGTRERDPSKLCRTASSRLRITERSSDGRREVQKHEACEQHRERTDAALPLVVIRPVRPGLIGCAVVGRVPTAREPPDEKEHREDHSGQGQQPLPREG